MEKLASCCRKTKNSLKIHVSWGLNWNKKPLKEKIKRFGLSILVLRQRLASRCCEMRKTLKIYVFWGFNWNKKPLREKIKRFGLSILVSRQRLASSCCATKKILKVYDLSILIFQQRWASLQRTFLFPLPCLSLLLFFIFITVGCGLIKKKQPAPDLLNSQPIPQEERPENVDEPMDLRFEAQAPIDSIVGGMSREVEEKPVEPLKVGIILGPGGGKTFAHTGVLRELLKAQIPIDSIVGMEWGALVAGMFAHKGQIHDTEWKLYKLQKKDLLGRRSFLSSKVDPIGVDRLKKLTDQHFGLTPISQMKVDFSCPAIAVWSGVIQWQDRGLLKKAVSRCWPYPPLFEVKEDWVAAAFALPESVEYLKKRGMELIIFVNVMDIGDLLTSEEHLVTDYRSSILWQEVRRSLRNVDDLGIEVVQVKTRSFRLYDFENYRSLVMAGEQAGRQAARALIQKYGF